MTDSAEPPDSEPAVAFASQRAASLRAMFPAGARTLSGGTAPVDDAPAPEPEPAAVPATRRRRWWLGAAIACAFALGAAAGIAAIRTTGDASASGPTQDTSAPVGLAPEATGPTPQTPAPSGPPTTLPAATGTIQSPPTGTSTPGAPSVSPTTARPTRLVGRPNPSRANLALHRPATASGSEGEPWPPAAAVDGKPDTRWSSAFTDGQWIAVDLGEVWTVTGVRLLWEHAYATQYRVEVSTDRRTWSTVYATSGGAGGTVSIDAGPVAARYVRVNCTRRSGSYGYSLFEFEVH
ncbi:discoidin domain-containing protein [Phytohabitans rumicis]|uniref:discoidin domain-containing protein n=1 Tax=Phytohabitans rumicis TaxID=1076125 RepID=UPI0015643BF6|nr:discoidin domain-containing protein [Phytohabitans rumicis]